MIETRTLLLNMNPKNSEFKISPIYPKVPWVAKTSPFLPKVVLAGPNLATKNQSRGPLLVVVPQTSLGYYKWSCFPILTAEKAEWVYASNLHETNRKDIASYTCF